MIRYPYRYFFILGILNAIFGVALWPLSFSGLNIVDDILLFHKVLLVYGFLLSFVCGFLITAYPNFTASARVKNLEWYSMFFGQLLIPVGAIFNNYAVSISGVVLNSLTMIYFMINRNLIGKNKLPNSFHYVWLAYFFVCISVILQLVRLNFNLEIDDILITNIFIAGVILNFIFGVGLKLFPVFLGHNQFVILKNENNFWQKNKVNLSMSILNFALAFDLFQYYKIGNFVRFLVATYLIVDQFKIQKRPNNGYHGLGIWIALIFIPIGIFLRTIDRFFVFGIHIFFICGFSLITVLVAGRVSASHAGHGLEHEKQNKLFIYLIAFAIISGLLRFFPGLSEQISLITFYNFAFLFWVLFFVIWLSIFFKKLFKPIKEA